MLGAFLVGAFIVGPFIWTGLGRDIATTSIAKGAKVTKEKAEDVVSCTNTYVPQT